MLKRLFRPTNRRVRWLVGILLVGLSFALYTRQTVAVKPAGSFVSVMDGKALAEMSTEAAATLEELARTDHIALLEMCLENARQYNDYTLTFIKEERIKGKLRDQQTVEAAFRRQPFSVAMRWTENAPRGDRVLYVEGMWNGKMLVRPTSGFLRGLVGGQVLRDPTGKEVMESTLRPVTMFGFENSLKGLLEVYRTAKHRGDLVEEFGGFAKIDDRPVLVLVRRLPAAANYPSAKTVTYIDMEYLVPVMVEGYDWTTPQPEFMCRYIFKDIRFNVGLPDDRFTPQANDMNSP